MKPTKLLVPIYTYTEEDTNKANADWGCNCGPAALATMCGITLDAVRPAIPNFEQRHYTSPTMMKAALANLGVSFCEPFKASKPASNHPHQFVNYGLVRIQWEGPWTAPGSNPKWAYRQTHWVGSMFFKDNIYIFDINGGWQLLGDWACETVPQIIKACVPRGTGKWFTTHHWELFSSPSTELKPLPINFNNHKSLSLQPVTNNC